MRASGKSYLGKELALILNYELVDIDEEIKVSEGNEINSIV